MRKHRIIIPLSLTLLLSGPAAVHAQDGNLHNAGLLAVPANRIVGTWRSAVALRPCGGGPAIVAFETLLAYHAGGTLSDTSNSPPSLRSPGHGIWRYLGNSQYRTRFQVFQFLPTGYDGYTDVQGTVILGDAGGNTSSSIARRYNKDGILRSELCADGSGERMTID